MMRLSSRIAAALVAVALAGCGEQNASDFGLQRAVDFNPPTTAGITFPLMQSVTLETSRAPASPDPFAESGAYFAVKDVVAPDAKRMEVEFCAACWIVGDIYTRSLDKQLTDFFRIVEDPLEPGNSVMRLSTTQHTDGAIIRSRAPLPEDYRITFRIGHINYGASDSLNGYDAGTETGEPWMDISALQHNGVYWAAIMDTRPAPHNNIWSHHHRKFFMDAWNTPGRIFGVTVGGVRGLASTDNRFGKQFTAFDGVAWRNGGEKPAFYYLPDEWYDVIISREDDEFSFSVTGIFGGIGEARLASSIDARENCLYHYNRRPEELSERCMNGEVIRVDGQLLQTWPKDTGYPDYFMMGDPHINFYEGSVLIDDLRLDVL